MMPSPTTTISEDDGTFLDRLALLTLGGEDGIPAIREIYEDPLVKVPRRFSMPTEGSRRTCRSKQSGATTPRLP
jgi:hypothetical protein